MFEHGKALKRFLAVGADGKGRDPRVLELAPAALVAEQAASEGTVASQSAEPWRAWRDIALIWVGHARRTGLDSSLEAAQRAGARAVEAAPEAASCAFGRSAIAEALLARFDLKADLRALEAAERAIEGAAAEPGAGRAQAAVAAVHAATRGRRALMEDDPAAVRAAAALMDAAIHVNERPATPLDGWRQARAPTLRLERAELAARAGLRWRDARLLEQAGRDLRTAIDGLDGNLLPLTRARAVRSCGQALSALGSLAGRADAVDQAIDLLEAGADLFDADHSPLDMAALLAAQAEAIERRPGDGARAQLFQASEDRLAKAWRLCERRSTALETEIRLAAARVKTALASLEGDMLALSNQEARLRARLARAAGDPVAWAVDQLSLAGVYEALDDLGCRPERRWAAAYARREAREVLRERGLGLGL